MVEMNLAIEQRQTHRHGERIVVAKGQRRSSGMDWEFGVGRCKLLHLENINNKVLLNSTGDYIQCSGIDHDGKNIKKNV